MDPIESICRIIFEYGSRNINEFPPDFRYALSGIGLGKLAKLEEDEYLFHSYL